MRVEVIYALPERQEIVPVEVDKGARAIDAVRASGLVERHPQLDSNALRLGIFGNEVTPQTRLAIGDRVEIYRTLAVDPKQARHARAKRAQRR